MSPYSVGIVPVYPSPCQLILVVAVGRVAGIVAAITDGTVVLKHAAINDDICAADQPRLRRWLDTPVRQASHAGIDAAAAAAPGPAAAAVAAADVAASLSCPSGLSLFPFPPTITSSSTATSHPRPRMRTVDRRALGSADGMDVMRSL